MREAGPKNRGDAIRVTGEFTLFCPVILLLKKAEVQGTAQATV